MAVTTRSTRELQEIILGPSATPDDWVSDLKSRISICWTAISGRDVIAFQNARLERLLDYAAQGINEILKSATSPNGAHTTELGYLHKTIVEARGLGSLGGGASPISDMLWDTAEAMTEEILFERGEIKREIAALGRYLERTQKQALQEAFSAIDDALSNEDYERLMALRDAKETFSNVQMELGEDYPPVALLAQAWLTSLMNYASSEILTLLNDTVQRSGEGPSVSAHLALRMLADLRAQREEYPEALRCAQLMIHVRASTGALIDAARYAVMARSNDEALRYVSLAVEKAPHSILSVLGDPILRKIGEPLLDLVVRLQWKARHAASQEIDGWVSQAKKITKAESTAEAKLQLPQSLMPDKQMNLMEADLLTAGYWRERAIEGRKNVLLRGVEALEHVRRERFTRTELYRHNIDACWDRREKAVDEALRVQELSARRARSTLQTSNNEAERLQRGCVFGLGSGCAVMSFYVAATILLGFRGMQIGLDSPLGTACVVLALTPITISVVLQVAFGFRRLALDSQVGRAIAAAGSGYEQSVHEADRIYRRDVERFRELLAGAEKELEKVETALRGLGVNQEEAA